MTYNEYEALYRKLCDLHSGAWKGRNFALDRALLMDLYNGNWESRYGSGQKFIDAIKNGTLP